MVVLNSVHTCTYTYCVICQACGLSSCCCYGTSGRGIDVKLLKLFLVLQVKLARINKEIRDARAKKIAEGKQLHVRGRNSKKAKISRKFYQLMKKDSDYEGEDYEQFTRWLGLTQ